MKQDFVYLELKVNNFEKSLIALSNSFKLKYEIPLK